MYRVTKEIRFCYGHRLLGYDGPCEHLHGHNGRLEITFRSEELDDLGMVLDFNDIKVVMKTWIDAELDHRMILSKDDPLLEAITSAGEPVYIVPGNPTAETIARLVFEHAKEASWPVERVKLWETDTSWAEYWE